MTALSLAVVLLAGSCDGVPSSVVRIVLFDLHSGLRIGIAESSRRIILSAAAV